MEHGKEHSWSMEHGALHKALYSFFMNNLNTSQASHAFHNYIQWWYLDLLLTLVGFYVDYWVLLRAWRFITVLAMTMSPSEKSQMTAIWVYVESLLCTKIVKASENF